MDELDSMAWELASAPPEAARPFDATPFANGPFAGPFGGPVVHQPAGGPVGGPPPGIDPVAGVLNLAAFGQAFAELLADPPELVALWYVDIRSFRSINPKYGYLIGNQVLTALANGIDEHLAHGLPITRLGGDRFVFVSSGLDFPAAERAYDALVQDVNEALATLGVVDRVSLIGGLYYLRDTDFASRDFKRALDYASIAHRNAKHNLRSALLLFTDEDLERDARRIVIEQSIDRALAEGQIEIWYQPQVDYTFGEVVGAETLARWVHPDLGDISPQEFIPVLENCGKIHDLDLFVWEEASRAAGRWRLMSDGKPVPISVNISRAEMFEPDLLDHFKHLQRKYELPEGYLRLEVTENAFVEEADRLYDVIRNLRANGMIVEMDDFGSGLSSLNMLKDVPIDVVKLDMGFVRSGMNGERGGIVLSAVIRMLQGLDTPIIAEGVETLEQAEMLKNMGCHLMQGFHFAPPMPVAEFEEFLAANATSEHTRHRMSGDSCLEELMAFDRQTSFLFNQALAGMIFFFIRGDQVESILVNDRFYEDCGLDRLEFGNAKVAPLQEVDEESRATLWRATVEAREFGSSMCFARVRRTGRWFEGCMRYIGESKRGVIFSLTICRSGDLVESHHAAMQSIHDFEWMANVLDKIVPNGFLKCRLDDELAIDFASPAFIGELGFDYDSFVRRFHNSFVEAVCVRDRQILMTAVRECLQKGGTADCDVRLYQRHGNLVRASVFGHVSSDVTGEPRLYLLAILKGEIDEDESSAEEAVLFDRSVSFDYFLGDDRLVIHAALPDGTTRDVEIENWSRELDSMPDNIDPMSAAKVLATVRDLRHHPVSGFTDLKCNLRGGDSLRWYHVDYTCDVNDDGEVTVVHGLAHDANDEMGSAKWWRRQAEICQLTGLLNRNAVEERINLLMRRSGGGMMFMIDLDGFKHVNDEHGHLVGDEMLREVGKVLSEKFRESDALGRYGGDEFVAFMPIPSGADARELAQRRADGIIDAIGRVEAPGGGQVGCSIGVAISMDREQSFYELLEVADQALYVSKAIGKSAATIRDM